MFAASNGHPDCVETLLKAGADPNHTCNMGWSPARSASHRKPSEGLLLILAAGGDPNLASSRGSLYTPLMTAAYFGNIDACCVLLNAGANPRALNAQGATASDLARDARHLDCALFIEAHEESMALKSALLANTLAVLHSQTTLRV